ncbi:mevalonate kinase [Streptomyces celluloflavus]|uniref:mevalonate kinase n=1 Tax=Streptomyces celluloflavus TaxID=58344 RepID=UPI0036C1BB3A
MKPVSSVQTAPGKVIVVGEHAVVYGQPAIATSIHRHLVLTAALQQGLSGPGSNDPRVRAALRMATTIFALDPHRINISVESDIPTSCGLGSSAAFSVTLLRALAEISGKELSTEDLLRLAKEIEAVFHGRSSGIDVSAVGLGGVIWFERDAQVPATRLEVRDSFDLVIGVSHEQRTTADQVRELHLRICARPDHYGHFLRHLGSLARAARDALGRGDFPALGLLMNTAQEVLNGMGLSTPTLEHMIAVARSAGASGAKLTGAGGGGAVIALAREGAPDVAKALRAEGFEAFTTRVEGTAGARSIP